MYILFTGTHLFLMELVERSCINGDHFILSYELYALYCINIVRGNIPLNSIGKCGVSEPMEKETFRNYAILTRKTKRTPVDNLIYHTNAKLFS